MNSFELNDSGLLKTLFILLKLRLFILYKCFIEEINSLIYKMNSSSQKLFCKLWLLLIDNEDEILYSKELLLTPTFSSNFLIY